MGWSARVDAVETMDRWTAACVAQTGMQNVYDVDGDRFMWEHSRREYDDGRITGQVFRFVDDDRVVRAGSFRIEGDGTVKRWPRGLRNIVESFATVRE
jgi:hypothetical protein